MRWGGYRLRRTAQSAGKAMLFLAVLSAGKALGRLRRKAQSAGEG